MSPTLMSPMKSPQRDLYFMADPALWITWPFLPLVRHHADKEDEYGVLFDAETVCSLMGYRCAVFICNYFLLPAKLDAFLALPRAVYDNFEEVITAGWRVD